MRRKAELLELIKYWNETEHDTFDKIIAHSKANNVIGSSGIANAKWVRYQELSQLMWVLNDPKITLRWNN